MKKRVVSLILMFAMVLSCFTCISGFAATPQIKNVIFMIPDGGGYGSFDFANMVKEAGGFNDGVFENNTKVEQGPLFMKDYLVGSMTTKSDNSEMLNTATDSAAAGTAMATGVKTCNAAAGVDPGTKDDNTDGKPLATILEAAQYVGKATGMVVNVEWVDATPAAFASHVQERVWYDEIYTQIENQGIDVVLGTGYEAVADYGASIQNAIDRGYTIISDRAQLKNVKPGDKLWGNMAEEMEYDVLRRDNEASLAEMTKAAITALSDDEDGFFLMVEGAKVDAGGHANDAVFTTSEYLAFDEAFKVAVEYAKGRNDTIVIAAPDHDTGGLGIAPDMTEEVKLVQAGKNPETIEWESTKHTKQDVAVFMYTPEGVPFIDGLNPVPGDTEETRANYVIDNTDIAPYIAEFFGVDLTELTKKLFVDVTDYGYISGSGRFTWHWKLGDKYMYAGQSEYYKDGEKKSTNGQVGVLIYNRFYVPECVFLDGIEDTGDSIISGITVNPNPITIAKGSSIQLSVTAHGVNNPSKEVWWSLEPQSQFAGTKLTDNGLLTIDANETRELFTIVAKSKQDGGIAGNCRVTITEAQDLIASDWAKPELEKAKELGLIPDTLSGADLTQAITRAEFAAVSVKAYEALSGNEATPAQNNPFTDTDDAEVLKAYNTGITSGVSANLFDPAALLDREQAATMLTRVFKKISLAGWTLADDSNFALTYEKPAIFADDSNISDWAKDSVYFMAANSIIAGIGGNKFAPKNITADEIAAGYANATREQAIIIAVRMIENLK